MTKNQQIAQIMKETIKSETGEDVNVTINYGGGRRYLVVDSNSKESLNAATKIFDNMDSMTHFASAGYDGEKGEKSLWSQTYTF